MYGCESWTIKKAGCQRINGFELSCWKDSQESAGLSGDPTISSSVAQFSSDLKSFPASGSFPRSQFFSSGGQSVVQLSISPSNEYSGLISFRIDWLDLLEVNHTLKSLLQHHSSKTSILWYLAFFKVHFSHPCITTGKPEL